MRSVKIETGVLFDFVNFAQTQVIFYSRLTSKDLPFLTVYILDPSVLFVMKYGRLSLFFFAKMACHAAIAASTATGQQDAYQYFVDNEAELFAPESDFDGISAQSQEKGQVILHKL